MFVFPRVYLRVLKNALASLLSILDNARRKEFKLSILSLVSFSCAKGVPVRFLCLFLLLRVMRKISKRLCDCQNLYASTFSIQTTMKIKGKGALQQQPKCVCAQNESLACPKCNCRYCSSKCYRLHGRPDAWKLLHAESLADDEE